jgi:hypothetical protein
MMGCTCNLNGRNMVCAQNFKGHNVNLQEISEGSTHNLKHAQRNITTVYQQFLIAV